MGDIKKALYIQKNNINGNFFVENFSLIDCIKIVKKLKEVSSFNLQQLREKFWKEMCTFSKNSKGKSILEKVSLSADKLKGNFICPPYVISIKDDAFYWLENMNSITIPAHLITPRTLDLSNNNSLCKLIFTYENHSQIVDVSEMKCSSISFKGNYICISSKSYSTPNFILVDKDNIYVYDQEKICQLNGVNSIEKLEELSSSWKETWNGYQLQIHIWAQVAKKLPDPKVK